jgi:hypothetical protein
VTRGDLFKTRERVAERGASRAMNVVVSRAFVAESDDITTVVCAPVYSKSLGLSTEVVRRRQNDATQHHPEPDPRVQPPHPSSALKRPSVGEKRALE